ncbi:M23 family metallopeptidase [Lysinibacillus sp. KU-BSD001]|uniref:M23 family metallopeptidase n=1 Tax=Lysinibacillus sp. KU-BSD001 TaxID=3141328 RepID=UPI0036E8DDC3
MRNTYHQPIDPEQFGTHFYQGDYEMIYDQAITPFRELVSLEQFVELAASFNQGVASYQLAYRISIESLIHYVWLDDQKVKAIDVFFDEQWIIHSLSVKPYVTYPSSDKLYTQNSYCMPVKGEWFVVWGGTNEFINYHYAYENQRYAYDLVQVQNGVSYKDTPLRNENFYAFNQPIFAPADGKVVKVLDGLKDNVPGEMDSSNPAGNYVIIEHKHQEYSLLAHLKQSSIVVNEGDMVKEGQCIGRCGNSGNSSETHLHFHIMDCADFTKAKSIRIRFKDGKEPIQGDVV